jgi:hypothetical protein
MQINFINLTHIHENVHTLWVKKKCIGVGAIVEGFSFIIHFIKGVIFRHVFVETFILS